MASTQTYLDRLMDIRTLADDIARVAKLDREALVYIKGYIQGRADQSQTQSKPPTPAA